MAALEVRRRNPSPVSVDGRRLDNPEASRTAVTYPRDEGVSTKGAPRD